jgi:hypothetical protein
MTVTPPPPPVSAAPPIPVTIPNPSHRSIWVLAGVAAAAIVGWIVNMVAGFGFPQNAPVEWVYNAGISLDLIGVAIATGIGALLTIRPRPVRMARVFPWLGLGFGVIALVGWAISSGGLWDTLLFGGRGRYMIDVGGAFYLGAVWSLGAIFSAYGFRRPSYRWHNAAAIAGIVLWALVLVGVLLSAVLYAADLTD